MLIAAAQPEAPQRWIRLLVPPVLATPYFVAVPIVAAAAKTTMLWPSAFQIAAVGLLYLSSKRSARAEGVFLQKSLIDILFLSV